VYAELDEAVVLVDPLLPSDPAQVERFWKALDADLARLARPLLVLVGCVEHGRSADAVAARYRGAAHPVTVVGDAAIRGAVSCRLDATFEEVSLPAGLLALPVVGMSPGERAFFLATWQAAVFADAVIGAGAGSVRVAPPSWGVNTPEGRATYDGGFRASLRAILAHHPEVLLTSHGDPILAGGGAALDEALSAPAWGD
jgi:broad specificity phosphatase PhoE